MLIAGSSIKCHQCNSYDNFHCGDPFYFEDTPDEQKTQKFLAECPADGKEYFCRKIYQNGELVSTFTMMPLLHLIGCFYKSEILYQLVDISVGEYNARK